MTWRRRILVGVCLIAAAAGTYRATRQGEPGADRALSGGAGATVFDSTRNAFALAVPKLSSRDRCAFAVGNSFFNRNWVAAPASTTGRDGLGPTFNAQSCSSCHLKDGRAQPPTRTRVPELGLLLRLSVSGPGRAPQQVPGYGGQLQDRAINGVPAEGRIRITQRRRPGRYDDGVSGRANRVGDERSSGTALGRFGWKANVPSVEQQNAGAFQGDIGITSPIFEQQNCVAGQRACEAAPGGGRPEVDQHKLDRVTFYTRTLAVPARRRVDDDATSAGERTFSEIGCSFCHLPELRTAASDVAALADQDIRPYTDLLLHDMGPGLADGRPDGLAGGSEWRTAALWGLGLIETVNRHTRFLHDGRARNLEEAILWHGGEAAGATRRFRALPRRERQDLIAFLGSL